MDAATAGAGRCFQIDAKGSDVRRAVGDGFSVTA